ncbi:TRAP transporter small permease [Oryzomicrobium sp.]|uniref:TRAP transporter small permease n=1 Tax=Oryzomicrobium sp. TaxID=1911578 RepID=UPI002FE3BD85
MDRLTALVAKALEVLIVACLALMALLVFGNVVLRYGFNSGIAFSEEVSRLLFVWLVFLGTVLASREHAHLGVDSLVRRLPKPARQACVLVSGVLMIVMCGLLFWGAWQQAGINLDNAMPVTGIPYAVLYAAGVAAALGLTVSIFYNIFQALVHGEREANIEMVQHGDLIEPALPTHEDDREARR